MVKKVIFKNKEILVLDFSNLKEGAMIEMFSTAKELILTENKNVVVLNIFNHKNYASPKFIRHVEKEVRDVEHLLSKNAITGISDIQLWIVKGINLWIKKPLHIFDSVDKALDFLVS